MNTQNDERRKAKRILLQDSFNFFAVIPKVTGMSRVYIKDISSTGLCFTLDLDVDIRAGQKFEFRLYTSPAFFLALPVTVVRVSQDEVAVSFDDINSKAVQALGRFVEFLELASEASVATAV